MFNPIVIACDKSTCDRLLPISYYMPHPYVTDCGLSTLSCFIHLWQTVTYQLFHASSIYGRQWPINSFMLHPFMADSDLSTLSCFIHLWQTVTYQLFHVSSIYGRQWPINLSCSIHLWQTVTYQLFHVSSIYGRQWPINSFMLHPFMANSGLSALSCFIH